MSLLLLAVFLLQEPGEGAPAHSGPRSGFEAGLAFLSLDPALGAEDKLAPGFEVAFSMSTAEPKYTLGMRAYYRKWEVNFEEFNQLPADLDGEVEQLGLNLVITYPLTGPLSLGVEFGGGGMRIEHDLDEETSFFFEGGAFVRLDLFFGLFIQAGGVAFGALTEFGGQEADSDHVSWVGKVNAGFELEF